VTDTEFGDTEVGARPTVGPFVMLGDQPGELPPLRIGDDAVIRSHAVIYRASTIGHRIHVGHGALVREHCAIGDDVSIGTHSVVEHHVAIGDRARLHTNCFVPEHTIIESDAWIGPGVIVTNARHPNRPDTKNNLEGVHISSDAVVGAGAVLLPGITIGVGAVVGAGAVVTDDVEPGAVVVGNPHRRIS